MTSTDTYEPPADRFPIGDAARILGVSVPTVRRWEAEGKITAHRTLGGQRRFDRAELTRVLDAMGRKAAS